MLVAASEPELATLDMPIQHSTGSQSLYHEYTTSIHETFDRCARLYSEVFNQADVSLEKLSGCTRELTSPLGPVGRFLYSFRFRCISPFWVSVGCCWLVVVVCFLLWLFVRSCR